MNEIVTLLNDNLLYIVLGLGIFSFVLFIMLIISMVRSSKIQKKYKAFMSKENVDVEQLLMNYAESVKEVKSEHNMMVAHITALEKQIKLCVQRVGVVRYNAIENVGADLSFAIALLDLNNNGVVINGIYSRNGSYTYAKPIVNAQSTYTLSDEEKEAIQKAIDGQ